MLKSDMIESILNRLFNKREIVNCDRDPYLHRWFVIRRENFGLFVHKFVRSDEDRALHDHPWNFIVIPIWRGYIEHSDREVQCGLCGGSGFTSFYPYELCSKCRGEKVTRVDIKRRALPILGIRYRPATYRHRVELLNCKWRDKDGFGPDTENQCPACGGMGELPSWSLFIRFRKCRDWGFWLPEGFKQWAAFWQEKCE